MFYKKAESNSSNYSNESTENEKVEGTPFYIMKGNEDGTEWILAFGTYKIKTAKTKRELREYLITDRYNIMCDMIIIVNEVKTKNQNI
nr:MAG: hypothetical protein [Microviridae sp.]